MSDRQTWSSKEELFPGVWVYRDVLKPEMNLIQRLEKTIEASEGRYNWEEATVGYKERMPDYRDCVDFKIKKVDRPGKDRFQLEFDDMWQDVYDEHKPALDDYCQKYNIKLEYWEAMNFIRYGEGQHFQEHADHGFSYYCVVSSVAYINDDYEGGGLTFGKLGLNIKPKAGDLYLFPSTYLFSHRALPVESGVKYSIVTMHDYTDKAHTQAFHNGDYENRQ